MSAFNDLPLLIIDRILSRFRHYTSLYIDVDDMLPFIAINSKWRQIGLPILYGTLIFGVDYYDNSSNAGLYTNKAYRRLAKSIVIHTDYDYDKFGNMSRSLCYFLLKLHGYSEEDVDSSITLEDIMDVLHDCLGKFTDMFPNISSIEFDFKFPDNPAFEVAQYLVKSFWYQLVSLKYHRVKLLSAEFLPSNLTCIHCNFYERTAQQLPKINPLPLKELCIKNPPRDFPLLFNSKTRNNSVTFPNLGKLLLVNGYEYSMGMSESEEQAHKIELHFPKLKYLGIVIKRGSATFAFNPKTIPDYLDKLVLGGKKSAICRYGKDLPVKAIGYIRIHADKVFEGCTEEFFRVTNYLLDQTDINHNVAEVKVDCSSEEDLDLGQVQWKDISKLELQGPQANHCQCWLQKVLPTKKFYVTYSYKEPGKLDLENFYYNI